MKSRKKIRMNIARGVRSSVVGCLLLAGLHVPRGAAETGGPASLLLKSGDRLAIIGDSITEQRLYSVYMETYMLACHPDLNVSVANLGWSGDRAPNFALRLEQSARWFNPTVATTCYGMNDGGYRAYDEGIGSTYATGMVKVVVGLKTLGARVLVGTPGAVDTTSFTKFTNGAAIYNENLATLGAIACRVAESTGSPWVNVHAILRDSMAKAKVSLGNDYLVCGDDGVHPGANGHLAMAYAFLSHMGLDGAIGTIEVSMKGRATASDGHRILAITNGAVTIESRRYPFCFTGGGRDAVTLRSMLPFVPFNEHLNRFELVVTDLAGDHAIVNWGTTNKTFTRAQLEEGVNLAAEFAATPFSQAFAGVQEAVYQKQTLDIGIVKQAIVGLDFIARTVPPAPDVTAASALLLDRLVEQEAKAVAAARAKVVPVTHTLRIEAL